MSPATRCLSFAFKVLSSNFAPRSTQHVSLHLFFHLFKCDCALWKTLGMCLYRQKYTNLRNVMV